MNLPGRSARAFCFAAPVALALAAGCNGGATGTDGSTDAETGTTGTTDVEPTGGLTSTGDTSTGVTPTDGTSTGDTSTGVTTDGTSTGVTTDGTSTGGTSTGDTSTGDTDAIDTSTGDTSTGDTSTGDTEGSSTTAGVEEVVKIQIVAFNDFHGNLEPPQGGSGKILLPDETTVDVGGAAFLATHVAALRQQNPNTIVVSAGDLIGATPLVSALFHDEPTIEAMNQIGLDYNAVGNHEFDKGRDELLRMQEGGCSPEDGCADGTPFPGASFQFLAANVLDSLDPVETLFPSYAVREVEGVQIAFIGLTLEATPQIVTPAGNEGLTFVDEAERVNALVPDLQAMGVEAIVVLIHEGGFQGGHLDACAGISGPIVEIVENLSDAVDAVISGHTHSAYNCELGGKLVTSAASFGRVLTDIDLEISTLTGEVTAITAKNVPVTRDDPDPEMADFVAVYKALSAPLANKAIGEITATLLNDSIDVTPGPSTMGSVLADAHLAATEDAMFGGAQVAFMNPGGVRADLLHAKSGDEAVDGIVTYGEAFSVQPFGNSLVVMTLTGAQIDQVLEQQFGANNSANVLNVSKGFTYAYSVSAPLGAKVDPASIKLDGVTIAPDQEVRVAVISYLASGGDSFSVFLEGTDRLGGVTDMEALELYLAEASPVSPPAFDRVIKLP